MCCCVVICRNVDKYLQFFKMLNKVLQSLENFDNRILKYSDSDTLMVCWIENFFKTIKWSCGWKFKHFVELSINLGKFWLSVHHALINCFKMLVFLKTNGLKSSLFNKGQCITFINDLNRKKDINHQGPRLCWSSILRLRWCPVWKLCLLSWPPHYGADRGSWGK